MPLSASYSLNLHAIFTRRMTTVLLSHMDRCRERELKEEQARREDDMFEEEDSDDEMEEGEAEEPGEGEKGLLREEFKSSVRSGFIAGADKIFDYE